MNMSMIANMIAAQNAQAATNAATGAIQQGQANSLSALGQGYNTGRTDVSGATGNAVNALTQGGQTAQGYFDQGLNRSISALGDAFGTANTALSGGYNDAKAALERGIGVNQPWLGTGQASNTMLANSMGLNGATGNQAALDAYKASPGYQNAVDSAIDAISRKAAALGGVGGNALSAIGDQVGQLALADYGNWQNRLTGVSGQGQNAAGQMQAGYTNTANAANQYGQNVGNLASNYGNNIAGAYSNFGNNSANLANTTATNVGNVYSGEGNTLASLAGNYGNNQAGIFTGAANNIANVGMQGAQLVNDAFTSGAASMDAQSNAAQNRRGALIGGLLSGLGSTAGYAMAGPVGGALGKKLFG